MDRNTTGFSNTSFRGGDDFDSVPGQSGTSFRGGDIPQNSSLGGTSFRGGDNFDSVPGLSDTSFRGGISDGYIPGANDGTIPQNSSLGGTSFRGGFNDGYVAGSTSGGLADTSMRGSFDTPVYPPSQPGFGSHVDVATSGTSTRSYDHVDSHHHSNPSKGGGLLGKLATKIFDNINSRVGPKHTDVAHSGTSTRSSDDHFGSGSSGDLGSGGTSFR